MILKLVLMYGSLKDGTTAGKNMKVSSGGLGSVVGFKGLISFFALRTAKKNENNVSKSESQSKTRRSVSFNRHQKASRGRCTARY